MGVCVFVVAAAAVIKTANSNISAVSTTALFFQLNVVGVNSSMGFIVYSAGDVVVQIHVTSLYFAHPTDVNRDIMFLGCPSVCVCTCMYRSILRPACCRLPGNTETQ